MMDRIMTTRSLHHPVFLFAGHRAVDDVLAPYVSDIGSGAIGKPGAVAMATGLRRKADRVAEK